MGDYVDHYMQPTLGSIHFLEGGGGPEEFRGGSLTFCLSKKGGSA